MASGLRDRRIALGLSLEDVQRETRIPIAHLEAIESGRLKDLPEGPWRTGYVRAYRERLGLDPDGVSAIPDAPEVPAVEPVVANDVREPVPTAAPSPPLLPLWAVRGIAVSAVVALIAALGWQARAPIEGWLGREPSPAVGGLDQTLTLRASREVPVVVAIDGLPATRMRLAPGQDLSVSAEERIEVDLPAVGSVKLVWNGVQVVPQGHQEMPRRLVFIDDTP